MRDFFGIEGAAGVPRRGSEPGKPSDEMSAAAGLPVLAALPATLATPLPATLPSTVCASGASKACAPPFGSDCTALAACSADLASSPNFAAAAFGSPAAALAPAGKSAAAASPASGDPTPGHSVASPKKLSSSHGSRGSLP